MRLRRGTCSGGGFLIDGDAPVSAETSSGIRVREAGGIGLVTVAAVMAAVVAPRLEGSPDETARISIAAPRAMVLVLDQAGGGRSASEAPGLLHATTVRLPEGF